ncbi:pectate lyase C [Mycena polygramma]|nr:pectate lyase C [Mycena polygramma]
MPARTLNHTVERRTATNVFPTPPTTSSLSKAMTIAAGTTFTPTLPYTRFDRGSGACNGQTEGGDADAVFLLNEGATLSRVVIGANQAEGKSAANPLFQIFTICYSLKVFIASVPAHWIMSILRYAKYCVETGPTKFTIPKDVCEDAITIKQTSASAVSHINFGGAKNADDKIVQHNGAGTVIINSFYAENFGKVYRSCGNCGTQYKRHVQINDLWAVNGDVVAGINTNYGDTATIRTTRVDDVDDICVKYTGNDDGDEPPETGSGPDSSFCLYSSSDITQL